MGELVTIGIPTYNRLAYLKEAVASALAQTYQNIEIVIGQNPHNDANITNEILAWCETASQENPCIKHFLHSSNKGAANNFNSIADAASGKYLCFIGDDDRLIPTAVEHMMDAVSDGINLVFANHYLMDQNGRRMVVESEKCNATFQRNRLSGGEVDATLTAWRRSPSTESSMILTEDFRRIRFRETVGSHDTEFYINLAQDGARFVFLPDYVSEVRIHPKRATTSGLRNEDLIDHLQAIPVPEAVEPEKARLLGIFLHRAVSYYIFKGNFNEVRKLVRNPYFDGRSTKGKIQRTCAKMPTAMAYLVYGVLYNLRNYRNRWRKVKALGYGNIPDS
jgi:glycosyltransferase involved in cell wall biosynthesis